MDGLRGIAMLLVFLVHFSFVWSGLVPTTGLIGLFLRLIDINASLGTDFFMLLSGFFAYGTLARRTKSFGEFIRGRLWRLYPLYLILVVMYVVGSLLIPTMSKLPTGGFHAVVFLLQTLLFLPGFLRIDPIMDNAWTLGFIVWFYPIEAAAVRLLHASGLWRLGRFAFLAVAAVAWAVFGNATGHWPSRTAMFWVGMALSEIVGGVWGGRVKVAALLTAPALVIMLASFRFRTVLFLSGTNPTAISLPLLETALSGAGLFCFVWLAYYGPEWWRRLLSASPFRQLGACSYSFYLTHGFVVKAFRFGIVPRLGSAAGHAPVFWMSQVAGLALSVVVAQVVYRYVEAPLSRLGTQPSSAVAESARLTTPVGQPGATGH